MTSNSSLEARICYIFFPSTSFHITLDFWLKMHARWLAILSHLAKQLLIFHLLLLVNLFHILYTELLVGYNAVSSWRGALWCGREETMQSSYRLNCSRDHEFWRKGGTRVFNLSPYWSGASLSDCEQLSRRSGCRIWFLKEMLDLLNIIQFLTPPAVSSIDISTV